MAFQAFLPRVSTRQGPYLLGPASRCFLPIGFRCKILLTWSGWRDRCSPSRRLGRCARAEVPGNECSTTAAAPEILQQPLWSSAVSHDSEASVEEALAECVRNAVDAWPAGSQPQLAFVFVSSSYQRDYEKVLPLLREKLPSLQHVVGCSGYGVLGMRHGAPEEWEAQPALSLTLACLPGVHLKTFHVPVAAMPDADAPPQAWHTLTGASPLEEGHTNFILLSDAGFGGIVDLLAGLDYAFPEARKAGGLNSSASANARRALWQWSAQEEGTPEALRASGCVGLVLQGHLLMDTLVAQGCRPLGEGVYSVARAHRSLVLEVQPEGAGGGRRAGQKVAPLEVVKQELARLPGAERDAAARNLMVGLVPDDFKPVGELSPGDFLVRQLMGADPGSGTLMIGDVVRVGQRLRFLVRDREGAMHDLVSHGVDLKKRDLTASLAGAPLPPPLGCLIFTCNGRGRGLYRQPHFDSRTLAEYVPVPSAGFFCNGEIGQVGSATYLHGFTCSAAIFRAEWQQEKQAAQQQEMQKEEQQQQLTGSQEGSPASEQPQ